MIPGLLLVLGAFLYSRVFPRRQAFFLTLLSISTGLIFGTELTALALGFLEFSETLRIMPTAIGVGMTFAFATFIACTARREMSRFDDISQATQSSLLEHGFITGAAAALAGATWIILLCYNLLGDALYTHTTTLTVFVGLVWTGLWLRPVHHRSDNSPENSRSDWLFPLTAILVPFAFSLIENPPVILSPRSYTFIDRVGEACDLSSVDYLVLPGAVVVIAGVFFYYRRTPTWLSTRRRQNIILILLLIAATATITPAMLITT